MHNFVLEIEKDFEHIRYQENLQYLLNGNRCQANFNCSITDKRNT